MHKTCNRMGERYWHRQKKWVRCLFFILHTFSEFVFLTESYRLENVLTVVVAIIRPCGLLPTGQNEGQCPPQFPCIQRLLPDYVHVQSSNRNNSTCFINLELVAVLEGLFYYCLECSQQSCQQHCRPPRYFLTYNMQEKSRGMAAW